MICLLAQVPTVLRKDAAITAVKKGAGAEQEGSSGLLTRGASSWLRVCLLARVPTVLRKDAAVAIYGRLSSVP